MKLREILVLRKSAGNPTTIPPSTSSSVQCREHPLDFRLVHWFALYQGAFELDQAVVVETPQLGNATYLFAKPEGMHRFLAAYTKVSKDEIRGNRANIEEMLGFLGRIIHGSNPQSWAKELRARIGETRDFAAAAITVIG